MIGEHTYLSLLSYYARPKIAFLSLSPPPSLKKAMSETYFAYVELESFSRLTMSTIWVVRQSWGQPKHVIWSEGHLGVNKS